jgi:hypothetical protein
MKIKNEKELFDMYVGKEPLRPVLQKPFINEKDGRVWASDGYMLITVNRESVKGKYKTCTFGNNLSLRESNCNIPLLVSDLQGALDQCPKEDEVVVTHKMKDCPECDASGLVDVIYTASCDHETYDIEAECPICDGSGVIQEAVMTPTGRKIPRNDAIIKLGDSYCKALNIDILVRTCRMLGVESMRLIRNGYKEIAIFELDEDIHVCISPMHIGEEDKESPMIINVERLQR